MATPIPQKLSSATFAKLSPHPYLLANLQPSPSSDNPTTTTTSSSRANGRQPTEARVPSINNASLSHAHGSSMVRMGDTTVICGVRGETLATAQIPNYRATDIAAAEQENELRGYDLLVPNIELATGCAPNFLPGVPPTTLAQTLSTRLYSLLHSSGILNVADLRIYDNNTVKEDDEEEKEETREEVKAYWVLYIDVLFISFDGNPFDAAWTAVLAALRDTKLPRAYWDADKEMVLCSRERAADPAPLSVSGLPVSCTAAVFAAKERLRQARTGTADKGSFWMLVDPDRFEESLCDEMVTVVVDRSGNETKILGISKSGGMFVGPEVIRRFVKVAEDRWKEISDALL
ncbi:exosome complex exonuclease RRP43 [Poronia punctata]|nr:exosome complex exonuclease RRP43 [Poronia punctata]